MMDTVYPYSTDTPYPCQGRTGYAVPMSMTEETERHILEAAAEDIGEQVAWLYVEAAFSPEAKARCEAMVDGLLQAMGRAIRRAGWMSEATRTEALANRSGST